MLSKPGINHKFVKGLMAVHPDSKIFRKSGSWRRWHADSALVERDGHKYIMVAFLIVFAVTMLIQFVSYLLYNVGQLQKRGPDEEHLTYYQLITGDRAHAHPEGPEGGH